jgi:acetylornithine deacetylase
MNTSACELREHVPTVVDAQFDDAVRTLREMIEIPSVGPWFGVHDAAADEGEAQA